MTDHHPSGLAAEAGIPRAPTWPFDFQFFATNFPDQVRRLCPGHLENQPVVLLHLADGRTLDLCHIQHLTPQWMAVAVFRDTDASCEAMDMVFVPYALITKITVTERSENRLVGFRAEGPAPIPKA